jgi:hypothetical protein
MSNIWTRFHIKAEFLYVLKKGTEISLAALYSKVEGHAIKILWSEKGKYI